MVGADRSVLPLPSKPGLPSPFPSTSTAAPASARQYAHYDPSPTNASKGKNPARGKARFVEWGENLIEHPPRAYSNTSGERSHLQSPYASATSTSTNTITISPQHDSQRSNTLKTDTVGSLLADIANCLNDTILAFRVADHRYWGVDEFEQLKRLEHALDEAAKDFQELSPLVHGQYYYENDRNLFSLAELAQIRDLWYSHKNTFQDWLRDGGPIDSMLARQTTHLTKLLHRAQCRAAGRIFASAREESHRCLGAHLVGRAGSEAQRFREPHRPSLTSVPERESLGSISESVGRSSWMGSMGAPGSIEEREQVAMCNIVGKFERHGDRDIAFTCDYCDGYIVWEDLSALPTTKLKRSTKEQAKEHRQSRDRDSLLALRKNRGPRELILPRYRAEQQLVSMELENRSSVTMSSDAGTRSSIVSDAPTGTSASSTLLGDENSKVGHNWMATGISFSSAENDPDSPAEKKVVFAPIAIANHVPPLDGEWQARLLCPYCDDWVGYDNEEAVKYAQDENGFENHEQLLEHMLWYHVPGYLENLSTATATTGSKNCIIM